MRNPREEILRLMLILERKRYHIAMDHAYPDVGMGPTDSMFEKQATEEIDREISEKLGEVAENRALGPHGHRRL